MENTPPGSNWIELKVTLCKQQGTSDGAIPSLIRWMEREVCMDSGANLRVKKTRKTGPNEICIVVEPQATKAFLNLNDRQWSGSKIILQPQPTQQPLSPAEKKKAILRRILDRRYDVTTKYLDLSSLKQDTDLQTHGAFSSPSSANEFFPAMMRVLQQALESRPDEAITSVSLSNNGLETLSPVTTLARTLPNLLNLDLSNNKFQVMSSLFLWRSSFPNLEQLILTGNPLEWRDPGYYKRAIAYCPKLQLLNGLPLRGQDGKFLAMPPHEILAFFVRRSGLLPRYARVCLEKANWNLREAWGLFERERGKLGREAFLR
ncbi:hypothetical protein K470DRAFT_236618 [Piedraia hortae CBS 480.64]|uniref:TAP-C domain-containing protein n=1 Tax=Piedraia hortae CBS 480.64 TaxID=1314780 RepID=A0A6A7BUB3_9PEZI|nr:hypothetical protein K470DRAFT_236618 [Piedraia hortae CBS 480.64]